MPESPARRVSFSERLSETPQIANRAPTAGQDRAPAMYSDPTSGSIRARLKGQVPTGPTFHTVWRVVRLIAGYLDARIGADRRDLGSTTG